MTKNLKKPVSMDGLTKVNVKFPKPGKKKKSKYGNITCKCNQGHIHVPKVRIVATAGKRTVRPQESVIREGCPPSPYLCVIVMSVVIHDIHQMVGAQLRNGQFKGFPFPEILHVDDTLLMCKTAMTTHVYLRHMIIKQTPNIT